MCGLEYFCNLAPAYGYEVVTRIIDAHSRATGKSVRLDCARVHHAMYAVSNVAWCVELLGASSKEVEESLQRMPRCWMLPGPDWLMNKPIGEFLLDSHGPDGSTHTICTLGGLRLTRLALPAGEILLQAFEIRTVKSHFFA